MNLPLVIREAMMSRSQATERALPAMGEEDFRAFYERTARPLWSYLSRITGDPSRADDYLQETYYRLYRSGASHESEAHRRNYLFQIATNLVRDTARRSRLYDEVQLPDEPDATPATGKVAVDRQAEMRTDLERAMSQLEPIQRELLCLAYVQGASHDEIAGILGLRAISVRTLLLRARKKIAGILTAGSARKESAR